MNSGYHPELAPVHVHCSVMYAIWQQRDANWCRLCQEPQGQHICGKNPGRIGSRSTGLGYLNRNQVTCCCFHFSSVLIALQLYQQWKWRPLCSYVKICILHTWTNWPTMPHHQRMKERRKKVCIHVSKIYSFFSCSQILGSLLQTDTRPQTHAFFLGFALSPHSWTDLTFENVCSHLTFVSLCTLSTGMVHFCLPFLHALSLGFKFLGSHYVLYFHAPSLDFHSCSWTHHNGLMLSFHGLE